MERESGGCSRGGPAGGAAARHLTCDLGLEGAAADVVRPAVFDADEVSAGSHGGVEHLVALGNLLAVHLHLGRTLDGHGQRPGARLGVVDDELGLGTCEREPLYSTAGRVPEAGRLAGWLAAISPVVPLSSPAP